MKSKRVIYIDVIRVVAMILVVLAHSCSVRIATPDHSFSWSVTNVLVGITEVAVPMFFMISGATILNSKKTTNVGYLFKHRLKRVIVPFIIWSIISAYPVSKVDGIFNIHQFLVTVSLIFHQPVLMAYWFIYSLFGLYLISPFIKLLVDHMDENLLRYLLWLWMIVDITLPAIGQFTPPAIGNVFSLYSMAKIILSSYLGYFVMGYLLTHDTKLKFNLSKYVGIIALLFVIKVAVRFIPAQSPWAFLNIASSLSTPVIAVMLFMCFKSFEGKYSSWLTKSVEFIAPLTYGIYLSHGLIINFIGKFISPNNYPVVFVATLIFSIIMIYIIKKIPVIKNLLA